MSYIGNTPEAIELKRLADSIEQSAIEAKQAAVAAKQSALWTMLAALISLFGIILNTATSLSWFHWPKISITVNPDYFLSIKIHINNLGILLATIGALLVWKYLTELNWANKKEYLEGNGVFEIPCPTPSEIEKFKRQIFLSRLGIWFIFVGGFLQIFSNYLSS